MWLTHLSLRELRQGSTWRFNLGELEQVLERAACSLACRCLPRTICPRMVPPSGLDPLTSVIHEEAVSSLTCL